MNVIKFVRRVISLTTDTNTIKEYQHEYLTPFWDDNLPSSNSCYFNLVCPLNRVQCINTADARQFSFTHGIVFKDYQKDLDTLLQISLNLLVRYPLPHVFLRCSKGM